MFMKGWGNKDYMSIASVLLKVLICILKRTYLILFNAQILNSKSCGFCPAALSLHFVSFGSYNKGYTVRGSARPSPKFFFHFVPEKLRISQTFISIEFEFFFGVAVGWLWRIFS